ncbi:NB-ARC domain-containing protein [Streptomyces sp. 7-21]|uniref:ATP-binding protein n=1 Tax=Streptomyces sp. 7-21 TaxID=2802283 RepID=UPI0027DBC57E|nr:NB-ARC domain-containing protein [Streptomyces sp. 7-21]
MGKTTLAVQVAHAAREHFPDGQLYVDLQGAGPAPADPEAVLGSFLRALGTPDDAIPEGVEERAGLYRSLLDGRRVLTLLDNARDAAQVRPLLPGTSGCATLITSRHRMVDLAGAHLVDLDVMSPEEALTLFTRIVGEERVHAESDAAMDVVAACGFLPLAIRIAASRLASRRTWTVSTLARKLSDERRRLDELQAGDQAVKATFELGYSQLTPTQARAFRLLGLAEGPDISLHAAAALLDQDPDTTEDILESLVDASLVESAAPHRYRLHDLVRLFARDCAEREEDDESRHAGVTRMLDFYLATTRRVYALQRPGDKLVEHVHEPETSGLDFMARSEAVDWLLAEGATLLQSLRTVTDEQHLSLAADIVMLSRDLTESGEYSAPFAEVCNALLNRCVTVNHRYAQGRIRIAKAQADYLAGRLESCYANAQQAMCLPGAVTDPVIAAHGANLAGLSALHWGLHATAEEYLTRSLHAYRDDSNASGEASILACLSQLSLETHRTKAGVRLAQECCDILQLVGSSLRLASGQYALARALIADGQYSAAVTLLVETLGRFRAHRQRLWEGMTLFRLAEAHMALEHPREAVELAERALDYVRNVAGPWRRAQILKLLGLALAATGEHDRARASWQQALVMFEGHSEAEAEEIRTLLANAQTGQSC